MVHPLHDELKAAMLDRLEEGHDRRWGTLQTQYPSVPASTFWRWLKEVREKHQATPAPLQAMNRQRRQREDALGEFHESALLMKKHAFNAEGELVNPALLAQSTKWLNEYAEKIALPDQTILRMHQFFDALGGQMKEGGENGAAIATVLDKVFQSVRLAPS